MRVIWSPVAANDLERITDYIGQDNPQAAYTVALRIYEACGSLAQFPYRNRKSRIPGKYDLIFDDLPYIVVYRIRANDLEIIRVYHSAQDWP